MSGCSDPVGSRGQCVTPSPRGRPWGAGNDFDLDPGGGNSVSWTLCDSVLLCVCPLHFTCPPPAPTPTPAAQPGLLLVLTRLPLPQTHFCQPEEGTAAQFLFVSLLAEHLPSPSCWPLLPCLSFLLTAQQGSRPWKSQNRHGVPWCVCVGRGGRHSRRTEEHWAQRMEIRSDLVPLPGEADRCWVGLSAGD